MAATRPEDATSFPAPSDDVLAGPAGAAGGHLAASLPRSPGGRGDRPGRRGVRLVGPRGPWWTLGPEPAPARGGGTRTRKTALAAPNPTEGLRGRGGPRRRLYPHDVRRIWLWRRGPGASRRR